jgi:hypothetical protein
LRSCGRLRWSALQRALQIVSIVLEHRQILLKLDQLLLTPLHFLFQRGSLGNNLLEFLARHTALGLLTSTSKALQLFANGAELSF